MFKLVSKCLFILCIQASLLFAAEMPLDPVRASGKPSGSKISNGVLTHWSAKNEPLSWKVDVKEPGDYYLFAELACNKGNPGAVVELLIDEHRVAAFTVQSTDSWNSFKLFRITEKAVALQAGAHSVSLYAASTKASYVCNLKSVLLTSHARILEYQKKDSFTETVQSLLGADGLTGSPFRFDSIFKRLWNDFPHEMNWLCQDLANTEQSRMDSKYNFAEDVARYFSSADDGAAEKQLLNRVVSELSKDRQRFYRNELLTFGVNRTAALKLYLKACRERRRLRLEPLLQQTDQIIFAKHQVFGSKSGIYNITESEGLHRGEHSSLNLLDLTPERTFQFANESVLKDAEGGILRDPELSFDAKRLLFAWRKFGYGHSNRFAPKTGNNQIYEMELASGKTRQLTTDETYGGNYEPCYMPNGDILYNSSRIVQHITCGWGDHSNLFLMNKDGKYQRRVGFDQVSTQFPAVLDNGQVIYLRRDYNDRGQSAAHALFVMNADGTGQTEFYGNQTGTPNSFMHPRAIPGSNKIACVLSGYHTRAGGQLALIDIREGRNHGEGIVMIPQGTKPPSKPGFDDGYMKDGIQYSDPFPLSENEFIVSRSETWCANRHGGARGELYGIYFMTADGRRELLTRDPVNSCLQPIPVMPRKRVPMRPSLVDYRKQTGVYYVQNVYIGAAVEGIKDKVKKIRVVEILYKHDTTYSGYAYGPGGNTNTVTPPAHPLALFDAKRIIGEATVYEDGSAMFEVPARTPVYFQLLDEKNRCIQTMRSWSTLMPNERFSCVGCHEDKNDTPVVTSRTTAMSKGVEKLKPFYGETRGFSFMKEVQPVFDKHCVRCHYPENEQKAKISLTAEPFYDSEKEGRRWAQSYVQLMAARPGPHPEQFRIINGPPSWNRSGPAMADEPNKYVMYWGRLGTMVPQAPYYAGAIRSGMIKKIEEGHAKVTLPQEDWDKLVAWIDLNCPYSGDYMEANTWPEKEVDRYNKRIAERKRNEVIEAKAIEEYIEAGQP